MSISALIVLLSGCLACNGQTGGSGELTEPTEPLNSRYRVEPEVLSAYPELTEFINAGLQAVFEGDYPAYRRLVARHQNPESESRFKLICQSLDSVIVQEIEPIELPDVPPPTYRVIVAFEFREDSPAASRLRNRTVALLVVREGEDWRLLMAPSKLQPQAESVQPIAAEAAAEDEETIDYPWDQGVDY